MDYFDQGPVDVRDHTSTSNGTLDEGIQLFISTDGQLKMARGDTLHLQILAGVPSLQDLSSSVLRDSRKVDRCSSSTRPFA
jgi:hypothetical protein